MHETSSSTTEVYNAVVFLCAKPQNWSSLSHKPVSCRGAAVLSAVLAITILSVRHTTVLCQNEWT